MAYVVSLKQFDGPLDLLLTLISKAKIDICDIFVSEITEQYLEYMAGIDELDMDSASEFLQMAAMLVEGSALSIGGGNYEVCPRAGGYCKKDCRKRLCPGRRCDGQEYQNGGWNHENCGNV